MRTRVDLRCRCGAVRGTVDEVSPETVNHGICYCDDCQTFAHFLGSEGITDPWGGSPLVQVGPARMRITEGREHVRCVRLSPKGLFRFYTECCKTPVGNTVPSLPFVGISCAFIDVAADEREARFGPRAEIQGRFAKGTPPRRLEPKLSLRAMARTAKRLVGWALVARKPSPLFDPRTNEPIVTPRVLGKAEREAHREGSGAARG